MDISALMSTMLSGDALSQIGKVVGVSEDEAKNVIGTALPALIHGAENQAKDDATSAGFAGALNDHAQADTADLTAFLSNVDAEDGGKIISHLLGGEKEAVTSAVAERAGLGSAQTGSILSLAAPLLMSLLGQQTQSSSDSGAGVAGLMGSLLGSGDMGGILSGLLGGGAAAPAQADVQPLTEPEESKPSGLLGTLFNLLR